MLTKQQAAEAVRSAKAVLGVTWAQLAEAVGRPVAWTTAALLGQHPMSAEQARAAGSLLDLGEEAVQAFQLQPTRGALDTPVPVDPTIRVTTPPRIIGCDAVLTSSHRSAARGRPPL
jgi:cyanate lyase